MKKLLPVCFLAMIVGSAALASPMSSVIHFDGGVVPPRDGATPGRLEVAVNKNLAPGFYYSISCELTSNNKSKQVNDTVNIGTIIDGNGSQSDYFLNGSAATNQISTTEKNLITNQNILAETNKAGFFITNFDDTDTLTVSNCFATPMIRN